MSRRLLAPWLLGGLGLPAAEAGFCHLLYINADTNLEKYQVGDMQELLNQDSEHFSAFMYMDRNGGATSNDHNPMANLYHNGQQTTHEYTGSIYAKLEKKPYGGYPNDVWQIKENLGELDTLKDTTFINFVKWAYGQCGQNQYKVLSFNMHGGGVSGISGDDSDGHSAFSVPELQSMLTNLYNEGYKFDVIGFDTCLMSAYSVAQALWPLSTYLLASEPVEPGYGWDYTKINIWAANPYDYAKSIIDGFKRQASGPNQLVLTDLQKFGKVVPLVTGLMQKLTAGMAAHDDVLSIAIEKARENTAEYRSIWETFVSWFGITDTSGAEEKSQMDLGSFLERIKTQCSGLAPFADEIIPALQAAVLYPKSGAHAVCTGRGCEHGLYGLALWFKKRRWMHGAYEHYAKEWGVSVEEAVRSTGAFVDTRLEKEIREGLPEWYKFLKLYYLYTPHGSGSSNICGGTAPGGASTGLGETDGQDYLAACNDKSGSELCGELDISGDLTTTFVKFPKNGYNYADNIDGSIKVAGPSKISFTKFDLEAPHENSCYDYVTVEGKHYCGHYSPGTVSLTQGFSDIHVYTDTSHTAAGFEMTIVSQGAGSASGNRRRASAATASAPPQCPTDGRSCVLEASCTCPAGYVQKQYQASGGSVCYACAGAPAATTCGNNCCPAASAGRCTNDNSCQCNSPQTQQQFSCGAPSCFCWACGSGRRLEDNLGFLRRLNDIDEGEESAQEAEGDFDINGSSPRPNGTVVDAGEEKTYPSVVYNCKGKESLCNFVQEKSSDAGGDGTNDAIVADIASWVTRATSHIGVTEKHHEPDGTTKMVMQWVLRLPTEFIEANKVRMRWDGKLPLIKSDTQECKATVVSVTATGGHYTDAAKCASDSLTLVSRARYYPTEEDYQEGKYKMASLQQQVNCGTLQPLAGPEGEMVLYVMLSESGAESRTSVPKKDGGLVVPMVRMAKEEDINLPAHSESVEMPCHMEGAQAAMNWTQPLGYAFTEVKKQEPNSDFTIENAIIEIHTNTPKEEGLNNLMKPKKGYRSYNFKMNWTTAELKEYEPVVNEPEPLTDAEDYKVTHQWWFYAIFLVLGVAGVAAVAMFLHNKPAKKAKRAATIMKSAPPPPAQEMQPLVEAPAPPAVAAAAPPSYQLPPAAPMYWPAQPGPAYAVARPY
eukprot:TRINITY_DN100794_c0_g1_i1.p1 TRINITY_DN100794_c0_g1~~TRINITY_DN100794_c0_g1_i1.p1  ORF type:complete len:1165 (+),score=331.65 TRINITY_DN100794_c0_g1_i1:102-3596(+)